MSHWGHFKHVNGRNNRRKQSKIGKFDTKKYVKYKSNKTKSEYKFPNLKKSELEKLKGEIGKKITIDNKKSLLFFSILVLAFGYLFYYLATRLF